MDHLLSKEKGKREDLLARTSRRRKLLKKKRKKRKLPSVMFSFER